MSDQDYQQVIKHVFEKISESLKVNIVGGNLTISHTEDSVRIGDGTDLVTTTQSGADVGLDVAIISATGLKNAIKSTSITVTDVAQKIPGTALIDRNGMIIKICGTEDVYFGDVSVTPTNGYPKKYIEELSLDIKDNIELYAICATGKTCEIRILEVS